MKKIYFLATGCLAMCLSACSGDGNKGTENGHEWVDLGLPSGTKWATCNVGATKPEEFGDYYAWGEVTSKKFYDWKTYLDGKMKSEYDCGTRKDALNGVTDIAGTQYDAAKANLGGKWRLPTDAQWDELRNECYWVWTDSYNNSNVAGYIVYKAKDSSDKGEGTSSFYGEEMPAPASSYDLSDTHIFLPAAEVQIDDYQNYDCNHVGKSVDEENAPNGYYQSSSPEGTATSGGEVFFFEGQASCFAEFRCYGRSVRAVIPGK